MDYYQTAANFSNSTGLIPYVQSIAVAVPPFFPILLFILWITGIAATYFAIFKATATRRFWQSAVAISFVFFIVSILLASVNTTSVTILSGYWIAFYFVMGLGSWYGLTQYK